MRFTIILLVYSMVLNVRMPVILAADAGQTTLRGQIIDTRSGKPIGARIYIQKSDGSWHFPQSQTPDGTAIPYQRQRGEGSVEMHTTLSPHPFSVSLPQGKYTVTVERGKEYVPFEKSIEVGIQPIELNIPLARWVNMSERSWYSGDTHFHRDLSEVPNLSLAEDLNVSFPISHWVTTAESNPATGNRVKSDVSGLRHIKVDETHWISALNSEYELFSVKGKPHTLGAFVVIGQKTPFNVTVPRVGPVAEWAHREGGLIDLEKHSWPWSAAIVPVMKVDLFELANNHCWRTGFAFRQWTIDAVDPSMKLEMGPEGLTEWGWIDFGFQTYYAFLNCGFRLQPTAGTASGVHPVPAGFGRVYVYVKGPLTVESWLEGLKGGRSFVTTGPMLSVDVGGHPLGSVVRQQEKTSAYVVRAVTESLNPISRIEIVVNGEVVQRADAPESTKDSLGNRKSTFQASVDVSGSSWIAVRCFEELPDKRLRFAHSSPVHIEVPGEPIRPRRSEINYLVRRVQEEIARNRDVLDQPSLDEFRQALAIYEEIAKHAR